VETKTNKVSVNLFYKFILEVRPMSHFPQTLYGGKEERAMSNKTERIVFTLASYDNSSPVMIDF
jgi:hypothetical protein